MIPYFLVNSFIKLFFILFKLTTYYPENYFIRIWPLPRKLLYFIGI